MESNADEREERALLARYHAQQPQPPVALDAAIRAAAREALDGRSDSEGASRANDDVTDPSAPTAPPPWVALAAVVAMVALVLPGLIEQPEVALPTAASVEESASVDRGLVPGPLGGLASSVQTPIDRPSSPGAVLADDVPPSASPAPLESVTQGIQLANDSADAMSLQADFASRGDDEALVAGLSAAASGTRQAKARRAEGLSLSGWTASSADTQVTAKADRAVDQTSAGAVEPLGPQRLQGRFRPNGQELDELSVTLLEAAVLIEGDWGADGATCDPVLTLDRRPGEAAFPSVERIAGRTPEDFVFLRLESASRVRLVHCTETGWVISAR